MQCPIVPRHLRFPSAATSHCARQLSYGPSDIPICQVNGVRSSYSLSGHRGPMHTKKASSNGKDVVTGRAAMQESDSGDSPGIMREKRGRRHSRDHVEGRGGKQGGAEDDGGEALQGGFSRAPGCKRTVALHIGYVGTAFKGGRDRQWSTSVCVTSSFLTLGSFRRHPNHLSKAHHA